MNRDDLGESADDETGRLLRLLGDHLERAVSWATDLHNAVDAPARRAVAGLLADAEFLSRCLSSILRRLERYGQ